MPKAPLLLSVGTGLFSQDCLALEPEPSPYCTRASGRQESKPVRTGGDLCDGPGPGAAAVLSDEGHSDPSPLLHSQSSLNKMWLLFPSLLLPLVFPACCLQSQRQRRSPHQDPQPVDLPGSPPTCHLHFPHYTAQSRQTASPCCLSPPSASWVTEKTDTLGSNSRLPPAICPPGSHVCPHCG